MLFDRASSSARRLRLDRGERGQALVEFALVIPVLVLIFAGIVQFGTFYAKYQTMTGAVAAAARFESICKTVSSGDAMTSGMTAASSLPHPSFTFKNAVSGADVPHGAGCTVASGTKIVVSGSADTQVLNLALFKLNLPLNSSVTVVEE